MQIIETKISEKEVLQVNPKSNSFTF